MVVNNMNTVWRHRYKTLKEYYLDPKRFDPKYFEFDKYELQIDPDETMEDVEKYSVARQEIELEKCANSFFYFCHKYLKVLHPKKNLMPFILYKYQRWVIKNYEIHRFNIISKFRQGGLTTVTLLWGLWKCICDLDQIIMVVSKTDREAVDIGAIIDRARDHLPKWMAPDKSDGKWNDHLKTFPSGGRIMFHTPEAARGKALSYLIIDEAAFIPQMEIHWKALYPVLSTGGSCIVISTVNGMGNWYEEYYHAAQRQDNNFNVIDLDFWDHPEYNNPSWIADQKAQLGEDGWRQEIERNFLSSGETYIDPKYLKLLQDRTKDIQTIRRLFKEWTNKDDKLEKEDAWAGDLGAFWIFKEPIDNHEYIIGVDAAEGVGKKGDNSSFQIINVNTVEQVAEFYSNLVSPHIFAEIIHHIGTFYNMATVVIENLSPGGSVISYLQNNLYYDNLYYESTSARGTPKCGIKTTLTNRPIILESLQRRIMNGTIIINSRRLVRELDTFIYNKATKKAEHRLGKHDDAIMALCLALYVRDASMRDIPVGAELPKDLAKGLRSVDFDKIREEVLRGAPEDWIEDKSESSLLDEDEVLPGVVFSYKRKFSRIIEEFGW